MAPFNMIYKDTSSIIIRKGAVQRRVVYNAETRFTLQNKSGSIDDVIVGRQIICLDSFNRQVPVWSGNWICMNLRWFPI